MANSSAENYQNALKNFEAGEYQECLRTLSNGFAADSTYLPFYELAAASLNKLGGTHEAGLFRNAIDNFEDFEPFFKLGYHFIEVRHFPLAVPFLERAHKLQPENANIAYELSLGYTATFRFENALEVLSKVAGTGDFWVDWRFEFCKVLTGFPETAEEFITMARQVLNAPGPVSREMEVAREKVDELAEMLLRSNLVENPQNHIRDWHFIQYGGAILDYFSDPEQYVAGGRYVALYGQMSQIRMVLDRLARFLEATQRQPLQIFYAPGRSSEILGKGLSILLGLPVRELNENLASAPQSLVVAGSTADFNESPALLKVRPDQTVFSLNHCWLENTMLSPDVMGFMSQVYTFPWDGGGLRFDPDTQDITRTEADERSADEIAAELAATSPDEKEGFEETLDFYLNRQRWIKGGQEGGTVRFMFMQDSPVPGSYFH